MKATNSRKNGSIWIVALVLVCVAILGYGFFYSKNSSTNLVYLTVLKLPYVLLIWAVYYIAVARKHGSKIVGFSFLAIFISVMASELIGFSRQNQEIKFGANQTFNQHTRAPRAN